MSQQHPIIAVTGSSGAGTSTVKDTHDKEEAVFYACDPDTFSQWETIPNVTDLIFYEGLHGGVVTDQYNLADEVDFKPYGEA